MIAHAIYIVIGECGEYSDQTNWPVCWRPTREEAESVKQVCEEQAKEHGRLYCEDYQKADEYRANMFDQHFASYGNDTRYCVWKVTDTGGQLRDITKPGGYEPWVEP